MSFTRYASFEASEVLEVKGTADRQKTASLDKLSDYDDFRTDDGYLYARIRAISSRVNKNHDGWPSIELAGSPEIFEQHHEARENGSGFTVEAKDGSKEFGFRTFVGKPIFVDHNNSDPKRARGVIADSKFRVLDHKTASAEDDYWGGRSDYLDHEHLPACEVELLLEIDAKQFPKLAKAIKEGDIDGFSMGCDVERSKCSHCGNEATTPEEFCNHIKMKGGTHDMIVESDNGRSKTARKSYENCYGIKFFEISAVFDPADPTALAREIRASVQHEGAEGPYVDPTDPRSDELVKPLVQKTMVQEPGVTPAEALESARAEVGQRLNLSPHPGMGTDGTYMLEGDQTPDMADVGPQMRAHDEEGLYHGGPSLTMSPSELATKFQHLGPVRQGSVHTAAPDFGPSTDKTPQSDKLKAPQEVDTLRHERVCQQCGADMDGEQCKVCNWVAPPPEFDDPDLSKARQTEVDVAQRGEFRDDENTQSPDEQVPGGTQLPGSYLQNRGAPGVTSSMNWTPKVNQRAAARINQVETPVKPSGKPATNEPVETVLSDPIKPVTSAMRTAKALLAKAASNPTKEHMSDHTVAATPADPSAKPDKQVDVTGVGGVLQATNEEASKPEGAHSWENKGVQVDVTGKGGVLEDSNQAASEPSVGTVDVAKNTDIGVGDHTKTWDNSNEPNSAVTDKAVQSHLQAEAAKQGVKPEGGADVQPQRREDVEQAGNSPKPIPGTQQWTGTDGNGVTKQADPVTNVPTQSAGGKASAYDAVMKRAQLVDQEIALGITTHEGKWARVAALESMTDDAVEAQLEQAGRFARVAATQRTAATENGGKGRLPSFSKSASWQDRTSDLIDDEAEHRTASTDEGTLDSGLFSR